MECDILSHPATYSAYAAPILPRTISTTKNQCHLPFNQSDIMPVKNPITLAGARLNLQRLCIIRLIVLAGQSTAIGYMYYATQASLEYGIISGTVCVSAALTLLSVFRLRKPWPVTEPEFFAHLCIDIFTLTVLLYFTGGATNPFVSYYLVPLTIAAATLPWRYTWIITGLSLTAYSLMLFQYHPLSIIAPHDQHTHSSSVNLHIWGMWLNFLVSALLVTFFVVRMAHALREQEQSLLRTRENDLQNEQILGIATLAAGTAHELGTPLSTMSVILNELEKDNADKPDMVSDIRMLKQQITVCKSTLHKLADTAKVSSIRQLHQPADTFLSDLIDEWQVIRPEVSSKFTIKGIEPAPQITAKPTLGQAIHNLLNNAADASPDKLDIILDWNAKNLILHIKDYGSGIPLHIADQIGKPFLTTKGKGLGLGLFLTHATVNRYGGRVNMYSDTGGGTLTELTLPVHA